MVKIIMHKNRSNEQIYMVLSYYVYRMFLQWQKQSNASQRETFLFFLIVDAIWDLIFMFVVLAKERRTF